jgi:hypothetical protein
MSGDSTQEAPLGRRCGLARAVDCAVKPPRQGPAVNGSAQPIAKRREAPLMVGGEVVGAGPWWKFLGCEEGMMMRHRCPGGCGRSLPPWEDLCAFCSWRREHVTVPPEPEPEEEP